MSHADDVYFDPYDVEINADPYPVYERLREKAPAYYNERYDFWALSRHEDVEKAHRNWQVFSSTRSDILDVIKSGVTLPPGVILFEDPPVHTMHRGIMSRVFTPKRMAGLEQQVRDFCSRSLDPLIGSDGFDIITELAAQLPMRVIGMLLGVPEEDQVAVRDKTDANLRTRPGQPMEVREGTVANGDMFAEYVEWRSKHPSDDLMTKLLNAEFEDEHGERRTLTRDEVLTYTTVLAGAGNETTGRLIGWLVKLLAEHPDQRREIANDRSLIPGVIDEALRFEPTGHASARYVTEDIEYHGTTIPAGSAVLLLMASANRDPRRYENPDVFDIHREDIQHLTFGFGIHYCLGASLARLEGRVALDELLNRFPQWDLAYDGMKLASTTTVRGWEHMPILCRPAREESSPMAVQVDDEGAATLQVRSTPVVVVSNDTHIGPRLVEDLRAYCPHEHLEEYDTFAEAAAGDKDAAADLLRGSGHLDHPNFRTPGHYDSTARLADYDHDGVAAGVMFHGSMNMEPIPFIAQPLGKATDRERGPLAGVGMQIYNRWLADFVSQAPHRHIGLAYLPMWDVDAAIAEVRWARDAGLRGVNFPAMRDGVLPEYNRRVWEPFWSACEDVGMPLVTHVGSATNPRYSGLEAVPLLQIESGGFTSRRAVWWLIWAGVFERHPGLKLVITETPGNWFPTTADELDALWGFYAAKRGEPLNKALLEQVPRRPSEYMAENVFYGASFASPHEVQQAVQHGNATQLLWGSDYPHLEGTFVNPEGRTAPSVTRLALRHTFCDVAPADTLQMVGGNAIDVYGLDADALQAVAKSIDAPTIEELSTPIDAVPTGASITAFRSGAGGWG